MEDVQHSPDAQHDSLKIVIDVVDDNPASFPKIVRASCDPKTGRITLPESLYFRITDGYQDAAHTFFHEHGHLFLLHNADLHLEPETPPCRNEDSEHQADVFANRVMEKIYKRSASGQLELFQ